MALEEGTGKSVRESETLSDITFYYAIRLEDGNILRVSKAADSIFGVFWMALPEVVLILIILMGLSFGLAHMLTTKLLKPVKFLAENMDVEAAPAGCEELMPFISMIRQQRMDILKSARMRQEFTANVTHELKTPLTSISGYAELIETGMANQEDILRFSHGIHAASTRLLLLINDIIRLSELDDEEIDTPFERLDLYEMARICVEMLTLNAEKYQVKITVSGKPCYINGNKQMIEELMYNLCDNAIRYNNKGGIVEVGVSPKADNEEESVLAVKDTGIGIPEEHQKHIFERFYRVDKSHSKSTGGTGLGLAIVKHIIARHNARMELDSQVGIGTEIRVYFKTG